MLASPYDHYRPTKTSDGEGGSTNALGTVGVLWGVLVIHEPEVAMIVDLDADVLINDVLVQDTGQYRAISPITRMIRQRKKKVALERIERPIFP